MSEESTQSRRPTPDQIRLLRALLKRADQHDIDEAWLDQVRVQQMDDGGMGSFRIHVEDNSTAQRTLGRVAAELEFKDADGAVVLVSLNTDSKGAPFEVDVWRTDFNPVVQFPERFDR